MNILLSDNLCFLRQKNGYTLESIAEIISVSRQSVSKWEAGETYPDLTNCIKLASLYKISLDELVNNPLREADSRNFSVKRENYICGLVDVHDNGNIFVPETVKELLGIHPGDTLLLLADKNRGIALVKCNHF